MGQVGHGIWFDVRAGFWKFWNRLKPLVGEVREHEELFGAASGPSRCLISLPVENHPVGSDHRFALGLAGTLPTLDAYYAPSRSEPSFRLANAATVCTDTCGALASSLRLGRHKAGWI